MKILPVWINYALLLGFLGAHGFPVIDVQRGVIQVFGEDDNVVQLYFVACKLPASDLTLFHDNCEPIMGDSHLTDVFDNFDVSSEGHIAGGFQVQAGENIEKMLSEFGVYDPHSTYILFYEFSYPDQAPPLSYIHGSFTLPGLPPPTPQATAPPTPVTTAAPTFTHAPTKAPDCLCGDSYEDGDEVTLIADVGSLSSGSVGTVRCGTIAVTDYILVEWESYSNGQVGGENLCFCGDVNVVRTEKMEYVACGQVESNAVDLCHDVTCEARDQCHQAGTCNSHTGVCSDPREPEGTACDDENSQTINDACKGGVCIGTPSGTDEPNQDCSDDELCVDFVEGFLTFHNGKLDGFCDEQFLRTPFSEFCCQTCSTDLCHDVSCEAHDQCHQVGICNSHTGVCSDPQEPEGTACDDENSQTINDACQGGVCIGTPSSPPTCIPDCDGKQCGDDKCDDVCGTCQPSQECSSSGVCADRQPPLPPCASVGLEAIENGLCDARPWAQANCDKFEQVTHSDAKTSCESVNMRLCTKMELENGAAANAGCGFDSRFNWSSDGCSVSGSAGFYAIGGDPNQASSPGGICLHPSRTSSGSTNIAVSCCSFIECCVNN